MTESLAQGICRAPLPFDRAQADNVLCGLPANLAGNVMGELLRGVAGCSPFLAQLLKFHGAWLDEVSGLPSGDVIGTLVSEVDEVAERTDLQGLGSALRVARARAALFIALCDLGGCWELGQVTGGLSELAGRLTDIALHWMVSEEIRRGKIPCLAPGSSAGDTGLFVIAMGKLGARELNYSSDIDLICLFERRRFAASRRGGEASARFVHVIRRLLRVLSEFTADGYVFRTDLRLRPNPSMTPVCMAVEAAENYYATVGRTWERTAYIKARPVAGDIGAGNRYLRNLASFIWRDPLDFAAIEDIEDILRKIRVKKGHFTPAAVPGCDIKLSPGGIREIELFVQTRQLIMGGRLPVLRDPTTLGGLAALQSEGLIGAGMCEAQSQAYIAHRNLEHRLQMIGDKQTQTIPLDEDARARVAALDGYADKRAWEQAIAERLASVHEVTEGFFDARARHPVVPQEVVLDEQSMTALGFENPQAASRIIQRWRDGGVVATRSGRARRLYAALEADIIGLLGRADLPDPAISAFDRFLSGLPAGVPVFSAFRANRHLLEQAIDLFTTAPRLAELVGRWPQTMDAVLVDDFVETVPSLEWLDADLHIRIGDTGDYERVLDIARVWARENRFRVAVQLLSGRLDPIEAGTACSMIAESLVNTLFSSVTERFAANNGPAAGRGIAVIAMGALGTREMTAKSDLDLILVYDSTGDEQAHAPLRVPTYFLRLARAMIGALSVKTTEGQLYPVNMCLHHKRCHKGRKGPVLLSVSAFEHHQTRHAGVREHIALMSGRVIYGDPGLVADIERIIRAVLAERRGDSRLLEEARSMREQLIDAPRCARVNHWSLEHTAGGLVDIGFLARTGGLLNGVGFGKPARDLIPMLAEGGWMGVEDTDALARALRTQTCLHQIGCVALERSEDPLDFGERIRRVMVQATGSGDFDSLSETLRSETERAASICAGVLDASSPDRI